MLSSDLTNKKVLITGGTRGIGKSIAEKMLSMGAIVSITGTKSIEKPQGIANYYQVDFSKMADTTAFANELENLQIDVLVNNAGINKIDSFFELATEDFLNIQQVNLTSPMLLCKAVIPHMKKQQWGRIINISSIWGKISIEQRASYSASKFGLDGMTVALAAEVAKFGILANCVAPGFTDTSLTRKILGDKGIEQLISKVPAGRLGTTDEIAELVAWLASPLNSYISGQNIAIDGGFTRV